MLEQMASLLNTQYNGGYLFGGSATKTAPVDISSATYAAASSPSTADTNYYQGDSQLGAVRVSDNQTVSYGVTADNTAFEQIMRAMNLVASNSPLSTDTLNEALDLAVDSIDKLGVVQTRISNASASIERASAYQTEYQSYAPDARQRSHQCRRCSGHRQTVDLSGPAYGILRRDCQGSEPEPGELSAVIWTRARS